MIEFHDVCVCYEPQKRHPVQSLDGLTLKIEQGDWVFLVGPSGAGKSSLLKLIFAGTRAQSGRIIVDGDDITAISHREVPILRRKIGIVFQDFQLLNEKTAWENVAFTLRVIGTPQSVIVREVPRALETVGLTHRAEAYPHELSGGEQQRIAIARAIVNDPKILLADEPTGNLDPQTAREVGELLTKINRERGTTIVMATHDRLFVDTLARRVVRLKAGRVVSDEDPSTYGESDGFAERSAKEAAFLLDNPSGPAEIISPPVFVPPVMPAAAQPQVNKWDEEEVQFSGAGTNELHEAEEMAAQARAAEIKAAEARMAAEARAAEIKAAEIRAAEMRAAEARATEIRAAEARAEEEKAAQIRAAEARAAEVRAAEARAAEARAAEARAAEARAAEARAAEERAAQIREAEAAEQRAALARSAEIRAAEAREAEARAAEARVAEARAAEARAAQIREAEARAAEIRAAEERAAQIRAAEERAAEVRAAEERAAQIRAAEERAAEERSAQIRAAEERAAQIRAAEIKEAERRAAEARAEEMRVAEARAAEARVAEARAAEARAAQARAAEAEARAAQARAAQIREAEARAAQEALAEQERRWQQPVAPPAPTPSYLPPLPRETPRVVTSEPQPLEYSSFDKMLEETAREAEAPARPPQFMPASGSWVAGNVSPEAYDSYDDPAMDMQVARPMARRIAPAETPPPPPSAHPLDPNSFVTDSEAPLGSPENPIVQYE